MTIEESYIFIHIQAAVPQIWTCLTNTLVHLMSVFSSDCRRKSSLHVHRHIDITRCTERSVHSTIWGTWPALLLLCCLSWFFIAALACALLRWRGMFGQLDLLFQKPWLLRDAQILKQQDVILDLEWIHLIKCLPSHKSCRALPSGTETDDATRLEQLREGGSVGQLDERAG